MKRVLLISALSSLCLAVFGQAVLKQVAVSHDNLIVTRVTATLSQHATWSHNVNTDLHQVIVTIRNCSATGNPVSGLDQNKQLSGLNVRQSGSNSRLDITYKGPFYIETSTQENPPRINIDLFQYKRNYTLAEHLAQATFYEKTGNQAEAAKQYTKMLRAFPGNSEGNYQWGSYLLRAGQAESAREKLVKVDASSKFFPQAQQAIARLDGKTAAPAPPPVAEQAMVDTFTSAPIQDETTLPPHRVTTVNPEIRFFSFQTFFGMTWQEFLQTGFMRWLRALPFWVWLVVAGVIGFAVWLLFFRARHRNKADLSPQNRSVASTNDALKQGMVIKLLEKGWKLKEISREIQLSINETKIYVRQGKKILKRKRSRDL